MPLKDRPCLVLASPDGNIYDEPDLAMVVRKGNEFALPKPKELIPLPEDSELFLLPGRNAVGLDPETGELVEHSGLAVAAFPTAGNTLTAHPVYTKAKKAAALPIFAYGAVGFYKNKFYISAMRTDKDKREDFFKTPQKPLKKGISDLLKKYPANKIARHLVEECIYEYDCPNAKNFCLGRFEVALPSSMTCNAKCVACLSMLEEDSGIGTPSLDRIDFKPSVQDLLELMRHHSKKAEKAIYSFGQDCDGEPLLAKETLKETISQFRQEGGQGTITINSNASIPSGVEELADAGLSSLGVSLNSARKDAYTRYFRPENYDFEQVIESIDIAKKKGLYVSLNFLFFPGFSDTEIETEALVNLIVDKKLDCIQLRNLNIDPDIYLDLMAGIELGPNIGLPNFLKRIQKAKPDLKITYFNPYVG